MKLIIDIPDEEYKTLSKTSEKEKVNELSYYEKIIANGIPYESKGDMISREALKEKLKPCEADVCEFSCEGCHFRVVTAEDIDNAPTVEPCYQTTSCLDCGNYDKENHNCPRYCEVIKEAIKSRPQGEWVKWSFKTFGALGDWEYKCSNCEKVYGGEYNFCPNCGAKMKGGKE